MDWKELGSELVKLGAPILGGAIAGPAGATLAASLAASLGTDNSPASISQALITNPDAAIKLKDFETQVKLAQIAAATQQVESVNKTLQTEAMGGSFWQRNHHAFECTFSIVLVAAIYVGLPLANVPVPPVPETVWIMIGGILGVTAWQRGNANVASVK
jgi:hypothetical protein